MSSLLQRVFSAVLGLPVLVGLVYVSLAAKRRYGSAVA